MEDKNIKNHEDLLPVQLPPHEINTYDIPELFSETDTKKTQCFNIVKQYKSRRILYRFYSILSILILFLTVIFSAPEVLRFIMTDLGAEDMIIDRFFGPDANFNNTDGNLSDFILSQIFGDLSLDKPIDKPSINVPGTDDKEPNETMSPDTEATPPSTSPIESETEPPQIDSPPSSENIKPIISMDMSLLSYGENYIYNDTALSPDVETLRDTDIPWRYKEGYPLVLVIHTHTTESYMPQGATHYTDDGELARSFDPDQNMLAVGIEFVKVLEANGIPTLHCAVVHDEESYRLSYQRAAESIEKYLSEYPSIQYVFDIHRDSLMRSNGELISAVTSINGEACAQVMPVVSGGFDGYEENLSLALKLRQKLNSKYINLCRPVCLRESLYNQNMAPVSLLLEIGTSGNTLEQAKAGARLTAKAIAELIKEQ